MKSKRTWGHTSLRATLELGFDVEVKRFGLFHHDPDHSDGDLDRIEELAKARAAGAESSIDVFAVKEGMEISLSRNPSSCTDEQTL